MQRLGWPDLRWTPEETKTYLRHIDVLKKIRSSDQWLLDLSWLQTQVCTFPSYTCGFVIFSTLHSGRAEGVLAGARGLISCRVQGVAVPESLVPMCARGQAWR